MNILEVTSQLKKEYETETNNVFSNYKEKEEKNLEIYREGMALEHNKELLDYAKNDIRDLHKKYLVRYKDEIDKAEKEIEQPKELDPLDLNNILLKLSLIKDNPKALVKEINLQKENPNIIELIEDISFNLENKEDITAHLATIRSDYPEVKIDKAKANLRYEKMVGPNLDIFNQNDTSAYELTNKEEPNPFDIFR